VKRKREREFFARGGAPNRPPSSPPLSLIPSIPLESISLSLFSSQDIENTAGSWDMYGVADERRYPGLQAEFFERAAAPVARREAILALLGLAGPAGILAWGAKGSKDVKLPITVGPQKPPVVGPRDRI
jgi:hypothetical protein